MERINGEKINMCEELGTYKYNIKINKFYLVGFKEVDSKSGKGAYSNGSFTGLNAIPPSDIIVVSENREDAMLIDARINLKTVIEKILRDYNYKFYNIEIIEVEEKKIKNADEMFEKLGYTKAIEPNEPYSLYYYADIICKDEFICFDLTRKNLRKVHAYHDSDDITIKELQAINQKCKELGWT